MSNTEPSEGRIRPVLVDFVIGYVVAVIGLLMLNVAIDAFLGKSLGNHSTSIVPVIGASYYAGMRFGRREEARPANGFAWRVSFMMLAVLVALNGVIVAAVAIGLPAFSQGALNVVFSNRIAGTFALGMLAFLFIVSLLAIRYFFGFAAKSAVQELERKRSKGSV